MKLETESYRQVFDALFDGVCIVDREVRVVLWNKGAERISGRAAEEVIGRRCARNQQLHVDRDGRRLCESDACPEVDCIRRTELIEDRLFIHHKDGHLVPVVTRLTPITDTEGNLVGAVEVFCDNVQNEEMRERIRELEKLALLDALTGVGNRRFCEMRLDAHFNRMRRYGWPFGIIFADIDRFKDINDAHGHVVGDRVLTAAARTLVSGVRASDEVFRWGGEEFVVLVQNVGGAELCAAAEKLRRLIETTRIAVDGRSIGFTISAGGTQAEPGDSNESLVERADALMYRCKADGRNRVLCRPETPVTAS